MVLFKPPFPVDQEPKNSAVIPAGSMGWLKGRLGVGNVSPVTPDARALEHQQFVVVKDPDANILPWGVTTIDPDDPDDTYSSSSATYAGNVQRRTVTDGVTTNLSPVVTSATAVFFSLDVGKKVTGAGIPANTVILTVDSATQVTLSNNATASASGVSLTIGDPIPGLYAEGYPGLLTGRFALKVAVPADAEQTMLSTTRHYTVAWQILKNGKLVAGYETFDVGPVGVVLFGGDIVTNAEVLAGHSTALDSDQVTAIIEEAAMTVAADLLDECGYDISKDSTLDPSIRIAIIEQARAKLFNYDLSTGVTITKLTEGGDSVTFSGSPDKLSKDLTADAMRRVVRFCKRKTSRYQPTFLVADRPVPRLDANVDVVFANGAWVM